MLIWRIKTKYRVWKFKKNIINQIKSINKIIGILDFRRKKIFSYLKYRKRLIRKLKLARR